MSVSYVLLLASSCLYLKYSSSHRHVSVLCTPPCIVMSVSLYSSSHRHVSVLYTPPLIVMSVSYVLLLSWLCTDPPRIPPHVTSEAAMCAFKCRCAVISLLLTCLCFLPFSRPRACVCILRAHVPVFSALLSPTCLCCNLRTLVPRFVFASLAHVPVLTICMLTCLCSFALLSPVSVFAYAYSRASVRFRFSHPRACVNNLRAHVPLFVRTSRACVRLCILHTLCLRLNFHAHMPAYALLSPCACLCTFISMYLHLHFHTHRSMFSMVVACVRYCMLHFYPHVPAFALSYPCTCICTLIPTGPCFLWWTSCSSPSWSAWWQVRVETSCLLSLHAHARTRTQAHTRTPLLTHLLVQTHIRTRTTHTHAYIRAHKLTHMPTYTHTHTHAYIHTHTHTLKHAYIHTHTHTHAYIHTHTHTQTRIHTHTLIHTHLLTNTRSHTGLPHFRGFSLKDNPKYPMVSQWVR